jgi:hypothetical protein
MRQHSTSPPGRSTDSESSFGARLGAAGRELHGLYLERARQMEPGKDWGWCSQCGRHPVPPHADDTCRGCVAEMPPDTAGSPA